MSPRLKDLGVLEGRNSKISWGSAPNPAGGLAAPPRSPAVFSILGHVYFMCISANSYIFMPFFENVILFYASLGNFMLFWCSFLKKIMLRYAPFSKKLCSFPTVFRFFLPGTPAMETGKEREDKTGGKKSFTYIV